MSEDYQIDLKKKDNARVAEKFAKESAGNKKLLLTMDLQNVLLCPKVHYYKQKLQVHNFTLSLFK